MRILGIVLCLVALAATGYSALTYKAPAIEADLEKRTAWAIALLADDGVEVEADGRRITLEGRVADGERKEEVLRAAASVPGVLEAVDNLESVPVARPYLFGALKDDEGKLSIQGLAPTPELKAAIEADIKAVFGNEASVDLQVAAGAPEGDWRAITGIALDALTTLRQGKLSIRDSDIVLEGMVNGDADVEAVDLFAEMMPEGFTWTHDVSVERQTAAPFTFTVIKDDEGDLRLSGFAPDEATRDALIAEGEAIAGDNAVVANIEIADGMPNQDWPSLVQAGIGAMKDMEIGRFDVVDDQVSYSNELEPATDAGEPANEPGIAAASETAAEPEIAAGPEIVAEGATTAVQETTAAQGSPAVDETLVEPATAPEISPETAPETADAAPDAAASPLPDAPASQEVASEDLAAASSQEDGPMDAALAPEARAPEAVTSEAVTTETAALEATTPEATPGEAAPQISVLTVDKVEDGGWSVRGAVPDRAAEETLVSLIEDKAGSEDIEVEIAFTGIDEGANWVGFAADHLATLDEVRAGQLSLEAFEAHLVGVVETADDIEPVEQALLAIDPNMSIDLQPIDPRPVAALDLKLSVDEGVSLEGALPTGLSEDDAVSALGLERYDGELVEDGRGSAALWRDHLQEIGAVLPVFEQIELSLGSDRPMIRGRVHAPIDADGVGRDLVIALGDERQPLVDVEASSVVYDEGAIRTSPLTGEEEFHSQGYWLPLIEVDGIGADGGQEACETHSFALLGDDKITFGRGERTLGNDDQAVLNALAALAITCLGNGGLTLEIGGHTDSRGAADMNEELSQARAEAVQDALEARGVAGAVMRAVGYGDQRPIADNDSDEGRAANRRITFEWKLGERKAGTETDVSGAEG